MAQERRLEQWAKREAEKRGWIFLKLVSPSQAGVPDRLAIAPHYKIYFLEFKAKGRHPTKLQTRWIAKLMSYGCATFIIDSKEKMNELFTAHERYY